MSPLGVARCAAAAIPGTHETVAAPPATLRRPTAPEQPAPPFADSASASGATCHGVELYHPHVNPAARRQMKPRTDSRRYSKDRAGSGIVLGAHSASAGAIIIGMLKLDGSKVSAELLFPRRGKYELLR